MYEKDGIVYADDQKPMIKVISVKANDDYSLLLRFSDGTEKIFNANGLIEEGIFTQLKDLELFKQAHVDYGTIVWTEMLDMS